jgi:chemotaxis family two-component system response regulator Rcp1
MNRIAKERPLEVLMVEDNPGDIRLAEECLKDFRIDNRLHVVKDGEEAIDFLRKEERFSQAPKPDLILLDLNLPKKDGCEVLADIKTDSSLRRIPVIVLTTSSAEEDILKAYDLQANCFITKPVDLDAFSSVLRSLQEFWFGVAKLPGEQQD